MPLTSLCTRLRLSAAMYQRKMALPITKRKAIRGTFKMEELMEILEDINPEVDYETSQNLVDDGVLTSFELVLLVTQISDAFGVSIPPA